MLIALGVIFLVLPVILITLIHKDKYAGLANAILIVIVFQMSVGFGLQLLNFFTYPLVLLLNIIGMVFLVYLLNKRHHLSHLNQMDWGLIVVVAISLFCLIQVHFNYSGKVTMIGKPYTDYKNFSYPYPYFADEWYAAAFMNQAIKDQALPLKNPFYPSMSFLNLEIFSHSFLAELIVLLKLDPVKDYVKLSVGMNTLIIVLLYVFLRYLSVSALTASVTALFALFITNGANLPGLWTLIPITLGLIGLILSLFYFEQRNVKMLLGSSFVTWLFYPSLFVLFAPALLVAFPKVLLKFGGVLIGVVIILGGVCLFGSTGLDEAFAYLITKFFYTSFIENAIPQYPMWHIVPWSVIVLALVGLIFPIKDRKALKAMIMTGLCFWGVYALCNYRFVIEYQRIIYATSILLVILSGLGLQRIEKYLEEHNGGRIFKIICFSLLLFVGASSLHYTSRDSWKNLILFDQNHKVFPPAAPANMYLTEDDLRIFKNIHQKKFLSLPWKGTVIGVSTDNYPRSTKSGTITIDKNLYGVFMAANCEDKGKIAKIQRIQYFYVYPIECAGFIYKDQSTEGLVLYEYVQ